MPLVYCALGSNIEPRRTYLERAFDALGEAFSDFAASSIYASAPFKGLDQDAYLNAACRFRTDLPPFDLLAFLLDLERRCGRVRSETRWDRRTLDLDIVFYGSEMIEQKGLKVPHYDLLNRDFFLVPLLELDPNLRDPRTGKALAGALAELPEDLKTDLKRL